MEPINNSVSPLANVQPSSDKIQIEGQNNIMSVLPEVQPSAMLGLTDKLEEAVNLIKQNAIKIGTIAEAIQFFNKNTYHKLLENGQYMIHSVLEPNITFREYNISLFLYFQFLKYFFLFLLVLSVPSLTRMLINYHLYNGFLENGFTSNMEVMILRFSVGNMSNPSLFQYGISVTCQVVSIAMIFGFIIFWKVKTKETLNWLESQIPQPNRYVISINGFPINQDGTVDMDSQIVKKIPHQDKIFDVIPVYDFDGQLPSVMKLEQLSSKLKIQQNRQQKDQKMIENLTKQKLKLQQTIFVKSDVLPLKGVYCILHFNTEADKQQFVNRYIDTFHVDSCLGRFLRWAICRPQPDQLKYKRKSQLFIKQIELPNPDDIIWQNMQVPKFKRTILKTIGLISLPIVTFGAGLLISYVSQQILKLTKQVDCNNYTNYEIGYVESNFADLNLVYCYCIQKFPNFGQICTKRTTFTRDIITKMLASAATSIIASIINCLLAYIIPLLASLVKYQTLSEKNKTGFWMSTIATVVNSLFLPLIFALQFNGISLASIISYYSPSTNMVSFPDMTRDWYIYAFPFYFSYLINSIVTPLIQIIQFVLIKCHAFYKIAQLAGIAMQNDLNQKTQITFSIQSNLSLLTVNLFIILSYSVQQPLFVIMGCVLILIQYLSHKMIILRYCKQLPFQKGQMNDKILSILPITLLIRCVFAAWSFTTPQMFPKQLFRNLNIWAYKFTQTPVFQRFFSVGIFAVLTLLIIIILIIDYFFVQIYLSLTMLIPCWRKKIEAPIDSSLQTKTFGKRIQILSTQKPQFSLLGTYRMQLNPKYCESWNILKQYIQKGAQSMKLKRKKFNLFEELGQFSSNTVKQIKKIKRESVFQQNSIIPIEQITDNDIVHNIHLGNK